MQLLSDFSYMYMYLIPVSLSALFMMFLKRLILMFLMCCITKVLCKMCNILYFLFLLHGLEQLMDGPMSELNRKTIYSTI